MSYNEGAEMREDLNIISDNRTDEPMHAAPEAIGEAAAHAAEKSDNDKALAVCGPVLLQVPVQAAGTESEEAASEAASELQESKAEEQPANSYLFALPTISDDDTAVAEPPASETPHPSSAEDEAKTVDETADSASSAASPESDKETNAETPATESEKEKGSMRPNGVRDIIVLLGMILIFAVCSSVILSSGGKNTDKVTASKNFAADVASSVVLLKSESLGTVFDLPKVYILPVNEEPAPVANPEGYGSEIREDGTEVLTYDDETISVKYWSERIHNSNCHFAEIKIAHPTQLKTAFAGGKYSTTIRRIPQKIAQQVNAVIAINADYCGYRQSGVVIRHNVTYRMNPSGWDILLIDSEGDFHIMNGRKVESSGILDEYKIVNTLHFGPSLIIDGEVKMLNPDSGCGEEWNNLRVSPRTGIGQIDRLHYLFCCVEGRTDFSRGIYTEQLAEIMLEKGCVQAYNLDGGMSTTMIFNGEAMNYPMWGGQRVVTDIIYCATAIPNE